MLPREENLVLTGEYPISDARDPPAVVANLRDPETFLSLPPAAFLLVTGNRDAHHCRECVVCFIYRYGKYLPRLRRGGVL